MPPVAPPDPWAPVGPDAGDLWFDTDSGILAAYYNDGNSNQWVEVSTGPIGAQGSTGAAGAQGAQGANGAAGSQGATGSATISNNADNRVITGGSGTNLNAESGLTFDGSTLAVSGAGSYTGNLTVLGTLTYEDVKNVDSVGIATARQGLNVTGGGIMVTSGIVTTTGIHANTGIVTATRFDASNGIIENANTISANYSIKTNNNAMSAGPISIASGISVTVPSGSSWTIV